MVATLTEEKKNVLQFLFRLLFFHIFIVITHRYNLFESYDASDRTMNTSSTHIVYRKIMIVFLYLFSLLRSAVCKNHKQPQCIEKCVRNESLKAKRNQDATLCVQDSFLFQYHMVFSSLYCSAALILDTRNSYFQRRHTLSIKG